MNSTMRRVMWALALLVAAAGLLVAAGGDPGPSTNTERVQALTLSIKCPTCRSQSVAESDAPLAREIRNDIASRVSAGQGDGEIRDYYVSRYGEEVLLNPPSTGIASLVWVVPVVVLVGGAAGLVLAFRRWRSTAVANGDGTRSRVAPTIIRGAGVLVFAVAVGVLVARGSGERGTGTLTGDTRLTARERLVDCRLELNELDLAAAEECYDEILSGDPRNAEALTYRGWVHGLEALSPDSDLSDEGKSLALEMGLELFSQALDVDPTYPDALAFRIVVLDRLGRDAELELAFAEFDEVDAPEEMAELVEQIRTGSPPDTSTPAMECRLLMESDTLGALKCFDELLGEDEKDFEALVYRGWALAGTGFAARDQGSETLAIELLSEALGSVEAGLAIDPDYVDGVAFAAIITDSMGEVDVADAYLVRLFELEPSELLVERLESYIPDARTRAG